MGYLGRYIMVWRK